MLGELSHGQAGGVLQQLRALCAAQGLGSLSDHLGELVEFLKEDVRSVERALSSLPRNHSIVQRGAFRLLDLGGKRLRPICVALASRAGSGFGPAAQDIAVAAELVHCATLLHDDVVDLGERRRGAPATRMVYGNAASIFAGDWLLIEALRRVRRTGCDQVLDELLATIDEMIAAESLQLEHRGQVQTQRHVYFRVVEGKTASLFRWALSAGAEAGGILGSERDALGQYGFHLGIGFQLVDDLLDYAGDGQVMGKGLFADLREGKMTYPLLVALEREPSLRDPLDEFLAMPVDQGLSESVRTQLMSALVRTESVAACRSLAREQMAMAIEALRPLRASPAKDALVAVAQALVEREV